MIIELIIFGIFIIAAYTGGFYFGYLKREDKPPELPKFKSVKFTMKKDDKEPERLGFYGQKIN